jgi:hypothetical protein
MCRRRRGRCASRSAFVYMVFPSLLFGFFVSSRLILALIVREDKRLRAFVLYRIFWGLGRAAQNGPEMK